MLDELRNLIIQRIDYTDANSEQRAIDLFALNVIDKINNSQNSDSLLPVKAPSERAGKIVQCILSQYGVDSTFYDDILFVNASSDLKK